MKKYCVIFNPKAGNKSGKAATEKLIEKLGDAEVKTVDITTITDYKAVYDSLDKDTTIIIAGGDGTISRFANDNYNALPENELLFYGIGSGNDFLFDIGKKPEEDLVDVRKYIVDLPSVFINGEEHKFINGIGYGIDGYCCEEGDRLREISDKPINYTSIAIKGLLYKFKPRNATVTIDGVTKDYKKAWLVPTMNGRCYGGGMLATPNQNRLYNDTVTTMAMYGAGKLKTLMAFPSIFKGEHIKNTKMVESFKCKEVTVKFDRPTALQIDGETYLGVTEYKVLSKVLANAKKEPVEV